MSGSCPDEQGNIAMKVNFAEMSQVDTDDDNNSRPWNALINACFLVIHSTWTAFFSSLRTFTGIITVGRCLRNIIFDFQFLPLVVL